MLIVILVERQHDKDNTKQANFIVVFYQSKARKEI